VTHSAQQFVSSCARISDSLISDHAKTARTRVVHDDVQPPELIMRQLHAAKSRPVG